MWDNTAGQARLAVDQNGNVGIGTTGPTDPLDVLPSGGKDLLLGGGGTTGSEIKLTNVGTTHFSIYNSRNNNLTFANTSSTSTTNTAGVALMAITTTGFVGIGTTAPLGAIDVAPSGGSSYYFRDSAGTAGTIKMGNQAGSNYIESGVTTSTGSAAPLYFSNMQNGTTWMTITSTGSVGIGTTAPAGPLTVAPPASQTVTAGATITANACTTVKPVTSTAARSTSTTDAFTNSTAAGCCMQVFNVGTFTITLKHSANFKTSGGADVSLTAGSFVPVCSDGSKWYQTTAVLTPS